MNLKQSKVKLGDLISQVKGGGTPSRSNPRFWNGSIPWASVKDFDENDDRLTQTEEQITSAGVAASATHLIPAGIPILCTRMAVGRAAIAKVEVAINQDLKALYPNEMAIPQFILLIIHNLKKRIEAIAVGSTVKGITLSELLKLEVPVFSLQQQHLISEILDAADEAIRKAEALISKLKQMKAGLLHDLLTRGLDEHGALRDPARHPEQFKDSLLGRIPQLWKVARVNEAGHVLLGRQRSPKYQSGRHSTPYLRVANVFDGWIDFSDVLEMDFTKSERDVFSLISGDILLNEGQSLELVGRCSIYNGDPQTYCFQNTLVRFRPALHNLPEFCRAVFKLWLDTGRFARIASQTTSVAHLGAARFSRLLFPQPMEEEQVCVTNVLKSHDARIHAEEAQRDKLKALKQGLMHALLTGKVRV